MNSLISLKYIHWFELDLKKGYRLNAAGVKHNLIVRNMTGLVAEKTPKQRTVFPEHWISIKYHRLSTPSRWMIRLHQDFKRAGIGFCRLIYFQCTAIYTPPPTTTTSSLEKKSVKQNNIDHIDYIFLRLSTFTFNIWE